MTRDGTTRHSIVSSLFIVVAESSERKSKFESSNLAIKKSTQFLLLSLTAGRRRRRRLRGSRRVSPRSAREAPYAAAAAARAATAALLPDTLFRFPFRRRGGRGSSGCCSGLASLLPPLLRAPLPPLYRDVVRGKRPAALTPEVVGEDLIGVGVGVGRHRSARRRGDGHGLRPERGDNCKWEEISI